MHILLSNGRPTNACRPSVTEEDLPGVVGRLLSSSLEASSELVVVISLSSIMIAGSFVTLEYIRIVVIFSAIPWRAIIKLTIHPAMYYYSVC